MPIKQLALGLLLKFSVSFRKDLINGLTTRDQLDLVSVGLAGLITQLDVVWIVDIELTLNGLQDPKTPRLHVPGEVNCPNFIVAWNPKLLGMLAFARPRTARSGLRLRFRLGPDPSELVVCPYVRGDGEDFA